MIIRTFTNNYETLSQNPPLPQTLPKGISALRNLRTLDLEGNKLEYLATEISYLRELQKLNVQSNRITNLPRGLGLLVNLQHLSAGENNLLEIPAEIGGCGLAVVMVMFFNSVRVA